MTPIRRRLHFILAAACAAFLLASPAPADPPPAATEAPAELVAPAPAPALRRLSARALEIRAAIDAEQTAIAALQARFDRAANESEAITLQREIERVKADGEVQLLRIQAKHARLAGREAAARKIDAAIESLLHPVRSDLAARRAAAAKSTAR